ncbi:hypothetical protein PTKIN_Ptkin12aG0123600 [Pterospermum kingtungense]
MGDDLNVPTCVLKVNTQCCAACPMKVKKKLQKINGVHAIDIDTKNGLVTIRGIVQPSMLIQTISEKFGKEAELHAYEKNPKTQNETLDEAKTCNSNRKHKQKNQTCCCTDDKSNGHDKAVNNEVKGSIPGETEGKHVWHHPQYGMKKKKHGFAGWFGKKSNIVEPTMFGKFGGPRPAGYARLPPLPLPPPVAPPLPLPSYGYGQYPPPTYPYSPPYRITKPPRPYPYDFYEKKDPPIGNSAFHSFREDNVNACSIM